MKYYFFLILFSVIPTIGESQDISKEEKEQLVRQLVEDKIYLLENYISVIGSTKKSKKERRQAIKSVTSLFSSDAIIEVSSKNKDKIERIPAKKYFERLFALGKKYDDIKITYDRNSVGNIELIDDKISRVDVIIRQYFEGYKNGNLQYEDYTIKNVEVMIYEKRNDPILSNYYDIIFNNIYVIKTTSFNSKN